MTSPLLTITSDAHEKRLTLVFPQRVISTNTDAMRAELARFWEGVEFKLNPWEALDLDFRKTEFVDSIGLNMIFDLVHQAEERKATIVALVVSRAVRLIFYTVRLDKKMEIRLLETNT